MIVDSIKMSDFLNRRKMYENAIGRIGTFVTSRKFLIADLEELQQRKQRLEETYVKFLEAHHKVIDNAKSEEFEWQDNEFAKTDEVYTHLLIDFNRKMKTVEAEEYVERLGKENEGSLARKEAEHDSKPILEFTRDGEKNRILYFDGTIKYVRLNKRAYIEIASDNEEEEEEEKSDCSREHSVPSKVVKVDLREKIEEKAARINEIEKELKQKKNEMKKETSSDSTPSKPVICNNCGGNHKMRECEAFLRLSLAERWQRIRAICVCQNCLMDIYNRHHQCRQGVCRCGKLHNTLLCDWNHSFYN